MRRIIKQLKKELGLSSKDLAEFFLCLIKINKRK